MNPLTYHFGACSVDRSARELRRAGELLVLPPKVFDCLVYLIEHRDRAVGRDELIAAVWGKTEVTDTLLGQTVLKARRAVGDTGNEQNAIRTVPRFGYRWVAELIVHEIGETPTSAPPEPVDETLTVASAPDRADKHDSPVAQITLQPFRRPNRIGLALAASVFVLAGVAFAWHYFAAPTIQPSNPSVQTSEAALVLPVDVVASGDWAWLRLGLMDLVASRLRSAGQSVVPSENVVALTRGGRNTAEAETKTVLDATGAHFVIVPLATKTSTEWSVRLSLRYPDGHQREVEARDPDVIAAGRAAADRLLALIGKRAPNAPGDTLDLPASELLSRAEAALLTDNLEAARQLIESAPPALQQAPEARLRLAQIDFRAGQYESARERLDALLAETSAEANPLLRARILNGSGAVNLLLDKPEDSERDYGAAIALIEHANQPAALGQAYTGRGISHASQGRYGLATADFSRARIALELAGDVLALARVEANEGIVDAKRGRVAEAVAAYDRAALRFERFGAINEFVATLGNMVQAQLALLRPAEALASSDRAWLMLGRLENPATRSSMQIERASALTRSGRFTEARALLLESVATVDANGNASLLAVLRLAQAQLDFAEGHAESAAALAGSVVSTLDSPDYFRERATAWLILTRALRASGQDAEAATEVERLVAWATTTTENPAVINAGLADAEQHWAERRLDTSRAAYERVLAEAEQGGVPANIAEVVVSYGSSLIVDGELTRAAAIVGQAARWADRDFPSAVLQVRLYRALGQHDAWQTALQRARSLAGERPIPATLAAPPGTPGEAPKRSIILPPNQ
jgi:DNA-binding winged helix-turn-helix (wHTH) protein/tetratricopeptide (TPR) repeat protein